jgi:DNA-binding transcriptional regulator YhcF (GntR family)
MNIEIKIEEWASSQVERKQVAAKVASELLEMEPGAVVPSKEKMASAYGIHPSTAQRIRVMLQGAGIVHKQGRHL